MVSRYHGEPPLRRADSGTCRIGYLNAVQRRKFLPGPVFFRPFQLYYLAHFFEGAPLSTKYTSLSIVVPLFMAQMLCAQEPNLEALKAQAVADIDRQQTFTQQMVDQIFSYSELGFQEVQTSRYLTTMLEKNGFRVERGVAGIPTAWVATYGNGK